jgi:hypothetical protein
MFCLLSFQLFSFVGGEASARINSIQMRVPPPRTALNSLTLKPISLPQTLILSPLLAVAKDLPSKLSDSSPTQTVAAVLPSFQKSETTHVKKKLRELPSVPTNFRSFLGFTVFSCGEE